MSHSYKFAIAQLHANPSRGERLNLAIVVLDPEGLSVHRARSLEKVKAISAALDASVLERALTDLKDLDRYVRDGGASEASERIAALSQLSAVQFSELGEFFAADADSYQLTVRRLLDQLVDPEPAPRRAPKKKTTRLLTAVKAAFRAEKILGRKGEGIDSHRLIANQEIAEGLSADLLLKNGAMHVVQTVDASHSERSRHAIQEIGMSVLVFEQARMHYGRNSASARLVYSANAQLEKAIGPSLDAAEHQGASLINWESRDDRTRFIVEMSTLAEPVETKSLRVGAVNASTQHRFKLN